LKALDPNFVNGVDSFVKMLGHIASIGYKMMTMCTAHVLIAAIRNNFVISSKFVVIYWLGVLWQTIIFGISMEKTGRTYNMMLHGMIPSKNCA